MNIRFTEEKNQNTFLNLKKHIKPRNGAGQQGSHDPHVAGLYW